MASCSSCKVDVGCGCNLNDDGMCTTCLGKQSTITTRSTSVPLQMNSQPPASPEFVNILKQPGLTKEEKLKRINDILEAARLNYVTQS